VSNSENLFELIAAAIILVTPNIAVHELIFM